MKHIVTIILFLSFLQTKAADFDGYYIGLRGDTTYCKFQIPLTSSGDRDYQSIATEVRIINSKNKKKTIKPGQIKSFTIDGIVEKDQFVTMKLYDDYVFLKIVEKGKIEVYEHFHPGGYKQFVIKYPFGDPIELRPMKFKKQILKYTNNDPAFMEAFQISKVKYPDLDKLFSRYNNPDQTN